MLTPDDYEAAAEKLGCEVPAIKAVASVQSSGKGFLEDGRPRISFHRHIFHKLTKGAYSIPENEWFSWPVAGGYVGGAKEYLRLEAARRFNGVPANEACAWGAFQVLGAHWPLLGFVRLEHFIAAMRKGEREHLNAFVRLIESDEALHKALKDKDWPKFARIYNGKDYAKQQYDTKMAAAYHELCGLSACAE